MRGWLENTLAEFAADNSELRGASERLLDRVLPDRNLHAKFLNTLSLLEHMGSHKIMSTQHSAHIDEFTLRHVAEEAHHAFFMKHQAEKVGASACDYSDEHLLAPATARMYFQRLEAGLVRRLAAVPNRRAAYLYMSMIVEFRALWFYELYQECLRRHDIDVSLKRILGEEQNHLDEMAQRLAADGHLDSELVRDALQLERRLYKRMISAMTVAVGAHGTSGLAA
ncbi:MAG TPA: hypothetical protein VFS24_08915 [Steroidobacteraceae bacterium]|nr:hypothetical protein [Steroidobacteraceae bacterium]